MSEDRMQIIARIQSPFPGKFGIPRQSGRIPELRARILFEPEFRNPDAFRGIEAFSHLWLIWKFSESVRDSWSPTVRPPRLGGNIRMGVFATRSPFRPNPIGLSCVRLIEVKHEPDVGVVFEVGGADLMDGTPIYDIKPYLPSSDSVPDAIGGFAVPLTDHALSVRDPNGCLYALSPDLRQSVISVLAEDPRPGYQKDPDRVYRFEFSGLSISFRVENSSVIVLSVSNIPAF